MDDARLSASSKVIMHVDIGVLCIHRTTRSTGVAWLADDRWRKLTDS